MVVVISLVLFIFIVQLVRLVMHVVELKNQEQLVRTLQEGVTLGNISTQDYVNNTPPSTIFTHMIEEMQQRFRWKYYGIFRLNEDTQELILVTGGSLPKWYQDKFTSQTPIRVGELTIGRAVATKQPSIINTGDISPHIRTQNLIAPVVGFAAIASFPLMGKIKQYGALVSYSQLPNQFTVADIYLFQFLANLWSSIVETETMRGYAKQNKLTPVQNQISLELESKKVESQVHRILLIEDNLSLRDAYVLELQNNGFTVITASKSDEGLLKAKTDNPEMILIDFSLGEVEGTSVLKALKVEPEFVATPCIILAEIERPEDRIRAFAYGAKDYILKDKKQPQKIVEVVKQYI